MSDDLALSLPPLVLGLAADLVRRIDDGVRSRGFADMRPAGGYALIRLAPDGATVGELAEHLDVTKQAASQLVDELVGKGYVERHPHPSDARARLVVMTERGWACTRAADEAAAEAIRPWEAELGPQRLRELRDALARLAPSGRLRPLW
ncbi:DNA-binding MarR family transcriptional regulator [Kitasatospora sp. MAP12-15]|uniref:MarR family winged helix-turn-helix transcriptional regulator n=1 Tax=unclassified Kitasatospora TaxID=2633591 RepID=UPI0024744A15|nr:MarR family winged helix-turn-helix transcriptional regulator [Kitasatospora sp. MAP12-44]MDH6109813.1 DNA-binding MarR family transcriptional regulator [Kitasatospora sp. MAP12-44]